MAFSVGFSLTAYFLLLQYHAVWLTFGDLCCCGGASGAGSGAAGARAPAERRAAVGRPVRAAAASPGRPGYGSLGGHHERSPAVGGTGGGREEAPSRREGAADVGRNTG